MREKKNMKKIWIIGIILLLLLIPVSSALDLLNDEDNTSNVEPEIKPLDYNTEIITFVRGMVNHYEYSGRFIRESYFEANPKDLKISGIKKPVIEPLDIYFEVYPQKVKASFFIGIVNDLSNKYANVFGIAIGNIEWSY
jgi:hypothetical protein